MELITPPQDILAEQSVLGGVLVSTQAMDACRNLVLEADWYRPAHADIWRACCWLYDRGDPVDPLTVGALLADEGILGRSGGAGYLHTLMSTILMPTSASYYATMVADKALLRLLHQSAQRTAQLVGEADSGDAVGSTMEILTSMESDLLVVRDRAMAGQRQPGVHEYARFVAERADSVEDWVLQDTISRQDVIMVLSPPGTGKTTLSRQVVLALAGGVHPFRPWLQVPPMRTLLVDLEVDPSTTARESAAPLAAVRGLGEGLGERAWLWTHVQGLNLRDPADARMFEQVIVDTRPDFVALGSLYKAGVQARGNESYEIAANEVREVFDRLRARHGFALWIEHHMPKGTDGQRKRNPFGSSVWEWWPSHGRVLDQAVRKKGSPYVFDDSFRGDRGERELPLGFLRGGRLPFTAIFDETEMEDLVEQAERS